MIYLTIAFIIYVVLSELRYKEVRKDSAKSTVWLHTRIAQGENVNKQNNFLLSERLCTVERLGLAIQKAKKKEFIQSESIGYKPVQLPKTFGEVKGLSIETSRGTPTTPEKWLSTKRAAQLKKNRERMRAYRAKKKAQAKN